MYRYFKFKFRLFKDGLELTLAGMMIVLTIVRYHGSFPEAGYWILMVFCGLALAIFIVLYHNGYREPIEQYCEKHHVKIEELEKDFEQAEKISFYIRLGKRWVFGIIETGQAFLVERSEIAKLSYGTESTGRSSSGVVYIYEKTGEITKIPCSKKKCKKLQKQIFGNE